MSEIPAAYGSLRVVPARPTSRRRQKCDRDVKLHLTDDLYEDLSRLARADCRTLGEYLRVVLERHAYGALGTPRG